MNEQLQKALAELLGKANDGIDTAGEFLASELPEVIQQLLMWHGIKSFVELIFGIFLILMILVYAKVAPEHIDKIEDSEVSALAIVLSIIVCIAAFILSLFKMNLEWLQIWIAPKVWLIEYAAKLAS